MLQMSNFLSLKHFHFAEHCFLCYTDESSGVVYTVELSKQGRSTVGIVITGVYISFIHQ